MLRLLRMFWWWPLSLSVSIAVYYLWGPVYPDSYADLFGYVASLGPLLLEWR
jgi:hypothetical protein